uniref:succinate dehydrogenase subunit 3 n=1 Tax=Gracilaria domingensis TaxID=172961 RepID=UPI001D12CE5E|nr:succinate dehydrogenase subunit 3 [Gracilaria domingensis]UAD89603.1 succinate dehydrogenase subunit 3 [Gracilaria domingensis]
MYNRPISPHITIYAAQVSSLASVWHRISGLLLTFFAVFCSIYVQLIIYSNYNKYLLNYNLINNFLFPLYEILVLAFLFGVFYHALNGLKQIIWDLGFFMNQKFLFYFFLTVSFIVCVIILLLIFN